MTSDALILSSHRQQQHPETALLLRRGPGLTVFQFVNFGAQYVDSCLNATYRGPKGPKDKINKFFSEYETREGILDELYKSDRDKLTRPHKKLRGYCRDLLRYADAQSNTIATQLVAFKIIVAVITKYPGIRRLFYHPKESCEQVLSTLKETWTRAHQDCGEGWNFYLDYTLHCLSNSKLTTLVEKEPPSELGRLELPVDDWNKVPIEELLSFCNTSPEFDCIKLSAIRYLTGILELPSFWEKGIDVQTRFSDILTRLCRTIFELIQDTEKSEAQADHDDVDLPPWIPAARDAADILTSSTFDGLLRLHEHGRLVFACPPQLPNIVDLLQRSEMEQVFPKASDRVSRVAELLLPAEREPETLGTDIQSERRYRLMLVHEWHPSLMLPLWDPSPVEVGAVGYLRKPQGRFVTLFNAFTPHKASDLGIRSIPSLHHRYGLVSKEVIHRQDKRTVAQKSMDIVQSGLRTFRPFSASVSRRYSYPLRTGHKAAYLCTETTDYHYLETINAPKEWFRTHIDFIMQTFGDKHNLQKEDVLLVIGTLNAPNYALLVSHSHPEGNVHFNVYAAPKDGQPWGNFTDDTDEAPASDPGPSSGSDNVPSRVVATKVSCHGRPWDTVLLARIRFKPDVPEPTSL